MFKENNQILRKELGLGLQEEMRGFKKEVHTGIREGFQIFKREVRDEISALISASEVRVEKRIVTQIAELLDTTVLPQIAELQLKMA